MAEVTQLKRYDARPINWGKWFLIGIGMLVSAFILLVPMIYIFVQAFSKGLMPVLKNLADPDMLHAIWLTVMIALIAVPVNLVFGILLAWLVTRFNFPGRQLLLTLLDIPFAVSPVVAGLVYLLFCVTKWGWGFDKYLAEANRGQGMKFSPKLKPYFRWLPVWCICCFTALTARSVAGWMNIICKLCSPGREWCWSPSL